jgi:hypothetical protein
LKLSIQARLRAAAIHDCVPLPSMAIRPLSLILLADSGIFDALPQKDRSG